MCYHHIKAQSKQKKKMNWKEGQQTQNTTCQHKTRGAAVSLHLMRTGDGDLSDTTLTIEIAGFPVQQPAERRQAWMSSYTRCVLQLNTHTHTNTHATSGQSHLPSHHLLGGGSPRGMTWYLHNKQRHTLTPAHREGQRKRDREKFLCASLSVCAEHNVCRVLT